MKYIIALVLLLITFNSFSTGNGLKLDDLKSKIDSVDLKIRVCEKKMCYLIDSYNNLQFKIKRDNEIIIKKSTIPLWISVLSVFLTSILGFFNYKLIKKNQMQNIALSWNQKITKLIAELIAEIDYPSGEEQIRRLRKSTTFSKNLYELNEILKLNFPNREVDFQFLSDWKNTVDMKIFKGRLNSLIVKLTNF